MNGLSKTGLVDELYRRVGPNHGQLTKTAVRDMVDELGRLAADQLTSGRDMVIPNVATLKRSDQAARTGRNPATGEKIEIPAKRVVKAKPAKQLRDAVL